MKYFLLSVLFSLSFLAEAQKKNTGLVFTDKAVYNTTGLSVSSFHKGALPSKIDLSKIGHISPKCFIQDKDLNQLKVVDDLIANGKESIPFLISKLDDKTKINDYVMDFWGEIYVGDVAFIILTDFFSYDCNHPKGTISGVSWNEFLGCTNPDIPSQNCYVEYIEKYGRKTIEERWQKIWEENKNKIYWDETERCFRVRTS